MHVSHQVKVKPIYKQRKIIIKHIGESMKIKKCLKGFSDSLHIGYSSLKVLSCYLNFHTKIIFNILNMVKVGNFLKMVFLYRQLET